MHTTTIESLTRVNEKDYGDPAQFKCTQGKIEATSYSCHNP